MPERIGESFLRDPVHRQLDGGGQRPHLPVDDEVDVDAARAGLGHQQLDVGGARLRFAPGRAFTADETEDGAHLADRLGAGHPDRPERFARLLRLGVDELLADTGLEDQQP